MTYPPLPAPIGGAPGSRKPILRSERDSDPRLENRVLCAETLLGSLLIDSMAHVRISQDLKPHHFYLNDQQQVFAAIQQSIAESQSGQSGSLEIIVKILEDTKDNTVTKARLAQMTDLVISTANVDELAEIVLEDWRRRAFGETVEELAREARNFAKSSDMIDRLLARTIQLQMGADDRWVGCGNALDAAIDQIRGVWSGQKASPVMPTRIDALDRVLGGGIWQGSLVYMAADSGMGKSAVMMQAATNLAISGYNVTVISFEMDPQELLQRTLAGRTGITTQNQSTGMMTPEQFALLARETQALKEELGDRLLFYNGDIEIDDFLRRTAVRAIADKTHLIFIDHVNAFKGASETSVLDEITKKLQGFVRTKGITIFCLAQVNTSSTVSREDKRPAPMAILGSNGTYRTADFLFYLFRPDQVYPDTPDRNVMEFIGTKGRNVHIEGEGARPIIRAIFDGPRMQVEKYSR